MLKRLWKYFEIAVSAVAIFIVVTVVAGIWYMSFGVFAIDRFDPMVWSSWPTPRVGCFRGGMAGDIKGRVLKRGMTRSDVQRLLGSPDVSLSTDIEYRYDLGYCSGFRIDHDDLHVFFDRDGTLERVAIIQH